MPPTTTPVPIPTPTQTVELRIPQEVIDQLRPTDPGWFTQPIATILAACIALLAAAAAFGGVWWQIRRAAQREERGLRIGAAAEASDAVSRVKLSAILLQIHLEQRDQASYIRNSKPAEMKQVIKDSHTEFMAGVADLSGAFRRLTVSGMPIEQARMLLTFRSVAYDFINGREPEEGDEFQSSRLTQMSVYEAEIGSIMSDYIEFGGDDSRFVKRANKREIELEQYLRVEPEGSPFKQDNLEAQATASDPQTR